MRLRTGHGPQDWSDNIPNCFARLSGHSGGSIHGELVRGGESEADKERRLQRDRMRKRRARVVDMNDYARNHRWEGKPRCGAVLRIIGTPCHRMAGHRGHHASLEAVTQKRQARQTA